MRPHLVAVQSQHLRDALGGVDVVVDHQDRGGRDAASARRRGASSAAARRARGSRTTNSAAPAGALAEGLHRAAVHLDQPAHQRQADAQAALRAVERSLSLHEQVEDAPSRSARDADAVVAHDDDRLVLSGVAASVMWPPAAVYLAALLSRLQNTCARRVGSARQLGRRGTERELVPLRVDQRPAHLDRLRRAAPSSSGCLRSSIFPWLTRETSSRSSSRRFMCCTCRSITSRAVLDSRSVPAAAVESPRREDRRERIAQLVGQHREELVLAPVGLLQALLGLARAHDLAPQARIEPRVVERYRGAAHELLERHQVARLELARASERERPERALADAQRIAYGLALERQPLAYTRCSASRSSCGSSP